MNDRGKKMKSKKRRQFLKNSLLVVGASALTTKLFANTSIKPAHLLQEKEEEVSPNEDLMREHGILKRVLLVYQEIIDRITRKTEFPPNAVVDSANIIRRFIEDYHERLEEDYLFPRFKKANVLVELVNVLATQHQKGRVVTDKVLSLAKNNFKSDDDKEQLSSYLNSFIRMYSPHEAREDTILFPAFKNIVSKKEYDSLGEEFEDKEHELFGEDGFEVMVDKVAGIEKKLGIYDLSKFTPKV